VTLWPPSAGDTGFQQGRSVLTSFVPALGFVHGMAIRPLEESDNWLSKLVVVVADQRIRGSSPQTADPARLALAVGDPTEGTNGLTMLAPSVER
jgi:hypothetical protein